MQSEINNNSTSNFLGGSKCTCYLEFQDEGHFVFCKMMPNKLIFTPKITRSNDTGDIRPFGVMITLDLEA